MDGPGYIAAAEKMPECPNVTCGAKVNEYTKSARNVVAPNATKLFLSQSAINGKTPPTTSGY
jgi:hypothetical protein